MFQVGPGARPRPDRGARKIGTFLSTVHNRVRRTIDNVPFTTGKAIKHLMNVLMTVAAVYLIASAALFLLQEKLIFFPQSYAPTRHLPAGVENLEIELDGVRLAGYLKRAGPGAGRLIVYFGGNAEEVSGNLSDIARLPGVHWALFNYRGYGNSTGKPSQDALFADAVAIVDELTRRLNVPVENVILLGRSLGSGVAVHVASKRRTAGLILATPYDSVTNVAKSAYPIFPIALLLRHPFDSLSLAKKLGTPALFLVAESDNVIPRKHSKNLFDHWLGEKEWVVIPGAGHNDISNSDAYWEAIRRFVRPPA